jgi:large subunit ribosomal protein L1
MTQRSKRYQGDAKKTNQDVVSVAEGVKRIRTFGSTKFDQSVDIVMHLGIDPKQNDQSLRGAISLPHGIGKSRKVVAFCEDSDAEEAKKAGAVEAGCDSLIEKILGGWSDFDVAVASPKVMGKAGKLGRVLGPQGKMPSPKNGTVTPDVIQAVREFSAGKVEYRSDAGGNVHAVVGKVSFSEEKLLDNIQAFISHIRKIRPQTAKGVYIKKVCLSATMSPSVILNVVS